MLIHDEVADVMVAGLFEGRDVDDYIAWQRFLWNSSSLSLSVSLGASLLAVEVSTDGKQKMQSRSSRTCSWARSIIGPMGSLPGRDTDGEG
jgi:hypothetical protein